MKLIVCGLLFLYSVVVIAFEKSNSLVDLIQNSLTHVTLSSHLEIIFITDLLSESDGRSIESNLNSLSDVHSKSSPMDYVHEKIQFHVTLDNVLIKAVKKQLNYLSTDKHFNIIDHKRIENILFDHFNRMSSASSLYVLYLSDSQSLNITYSSSMEGCSRNAFFSEKSAFAWMDALASTKDVILQSPDQLYWKIPTFLDPIKGLESGDISSLTSLILYASEVFFPFPTSAKVSSSDLKPYSRPIDIVLITLCMDLACEHDETLVHASQSFLQGSVSMIRASVSQIKTSFQDTPVLMTLFLESLHADLGNSIEFRSDVFLSKLWHSSYFRSLLGSHISLEADSHWIPVVSLRIPEESSAESSWATSFSFHEFTSLFLTSFFSESFKQDKVPLLDWRMMVQIMAHSSIVTTSSTFPTSSPFYSPSMAFNSRDSVDGVSAPSSWIWTTNILSTLSSSIDSGILTRTQDVRCGSHALFSSLNPFNSISNSHSNIKTLASYLTKEYFREELVFHSLRALLTGQKAPYLVDRLQATRTSFDPLWYTPAYLQPTFRDILDKKLKQRGFLQESMNGDLKDSNSNDNNINPFDSWNIWPGYATSFPQRRALARHHFMVSLDVFLDTIIKNLREWQHLPWVTAAASTSSFTSTSTATATSTSPSIPLQGKSLDDILTMDFDFLTSRYFAGEDNNNNYNNNNAGAKIWKKKKNQMNNRRSNKAGKKSDKLDKTPQFTPSLSSSSTLPVVFQAKEIIETMLLEDGSWDPWFPFTSYSIDCWFQVFQSPSFTQAMSSTSALQDVSSWPSFYVQLSYYLHDMMTHFSFLDFPMAMRSLTQAQHVWSNVQHQVHYFHHSLYPLQLQCHQEASQEAF